MTNDRDHIGVVDETLGDGAGFHTIPGIVGEPDLETPPARPGGTTVDLVQRELNALLIGEAIGAAEGAGRAKGDGAGLPARAGGKKRQQCNTLQVNRRSRRDVISAASPGTAMTTNPRVV